MEFIDNKGNTEYHQTDHLMNNVIFKILFTKYLSFVVLQATLYRGGYSRFAPY